MQAVFKGRSTCNTYWGDHSAVQKSFSFKEKWKKRNSPPIIRFQSFLTLPVTINCPYRDSYNSINKCQPNLRLLKNFGRLINSAVAITPVFVFLLSLFFGLRSRFFFTQSSPAKRDGRKKRAFRPLGSFPPAKTT